MWRSKKYLILVQVLHHLLLEIVVAHQERVFLVQQILELALEVVDLAVVILFVVLVGSNLFSHLLLHFLVAVAIAVVSAAVEQFRDLVKLFDDSEVLGVLLVFVDGGMAFDGFEVAPEDSDAVEEVFLKIESIFLSQPQLIVIVV